MKTGRNIRHRIANWIEEHPVAWIAGMLMLSVVIVLAPTAHLPKFIQERLDCYSSGGEWSRAGFTGTEGCLITYPDGGKACTKSDQCQGGCIVTQNLSGMGPIVGGTVVGECKQTNVGFGCYAPIEQPTAYSCKD